MNGFYFGENQKSFHRRYDFSVGSMTLIGLFIITPLFSFPGRNIKFLRKYGQIRIGLIKTLKKGNNQIPR